MQLNELLKKKRTENGYSMRDLSRKSGVSLGRVCALEKPHGNPSFETMVKIANAYNIELWRLIKQIEPERG